jgi:hypothetical protein
LVRVRSKARTVSKLVNDNRKTGMTQVTRKRTQLEKLQDTNSDFAKLPTGGKVIALLMFPGSFIILVILVLILHTSP